MLERDEVPKQILVTSSFIRPAMFAFPVKVVLQDSAGRDDAARPSGPKGQRARLQIGLQMRVRRRESAPSRGARAGPLEASGSLRGPVLLPFPQEKRGW